MKRRLVRMALALLAVCVGCSGCYSGEGSGQVALATYPVERFEKVVLNGEGGVTITPGEYAVSVSAEDDVLPSIRVERTGDALLLRREVDWIDGVRATVPIEFRVSMPTVGAVAVSGSGAVAIRGMKSAGELTLSVSGSGAIDAADVESALLAIEASGAGRISATAIQTRELACDISDSGRVAVAGAARQASVEISGAGLFRGSHLRTSSARAEVRGSGQAFLWADERLEVQVKDAGRVTYRGNPAIESTVARDGQLIAWSEKAARPREQPPGARN